MEGISRVSLVLDPETGYLPADPPFHDADLAEVKRAFVYGFAPGNARRKKVFGAYQRHYQEWRRILDSRQPLEQWLDGSFISSKAEPRDLDMVTFLPARQLQELPQDEYNAMIALFPQCHVKGGLLHSFHVPDLPRDASPHERLEAEAQRERMFKRFSSDRDGTQKGIVRAEV